MLNDANKNFSRMVNKIAYVMRARVLLLAVHCNLYFDSHCHSLQFEYMFVWAKCRPAFNSVVVCIEKM